MINFNTAMTVFIFSIPVHVFAITCPAELLDLTNWKITLPIGTGTSPTEVKQPALATLTNDYFHLNTTQDGVVFKAHCGGVTTSNSGYPRSELREMINNGVTNASWSTSTGVHTMYVRQAITHLPDVKRHVVAGQIHDANDDVIMIRLEGTKLFPEYNGTGGPTLTNTYQLGTIFTIRFVAENGHVKTYYNDAVTPSDDIVAAKTGCYFKAGCYTQSNVSKGDSANAYAEVVVYDLQISHSATSAIVPDRHLLSGSTPQAQPSGLDKKVFTIDGRLADKSMQTTYGVKRAGLQMQINGRLKPVVNE